MIQCKIKHKHLHLCYFKKSSIHSSFSKRKRVIAAARIQPVLQFLVLYLLLNCSQQKPTGQWHTWHKAQRGLLPNYSWRENNRPIADKQIESLKWSLKLNVDEQPKNSLKYTEITPVNSYFQQIMLLKVFSSTSFQTCRFKANTLDLVTNYLPRIFP